MTKCLAEHAEQVQPRCHHLLEESGIIPKEAQQELRATKADLQEAESDDQKQEAKEDESKTEAAPRPPITRELPSLSMKASLQQMHDNIKKDIAATRIAVQKDSSHPVEASPQKTAEKKEKDMTEGTPAWLTGDIEAPRGQKDMGGWTMNAYTKEQQARLHVDEEGRPVAQHAHDKAQPAETPTTEVKKESKQETSMVESAAQES